VGGNDGDSGDWSGLISGTIGISGVGGGRGLSPFTGSGPGDDGGE
jgi:hypothetical protein